MIDAVRKSNRAAHHMARKKSKSGTNAASSSSSPGKSPSHNDPAVSNNGGSGGGDDDDGADGGDAGRRQQQKDDKEIERILTRRKLVRKLIPKDGSCLFRAISEHVMRSQGNVFSLSSRAHLVALRLSAEFFRFASSFPAIDRSHLIVRHKTVAQHMLVREDCVRFMRIHREDYEPFVSVDGEEGTTTYDGYLNELAKVRPQRTSKQHLTILLSIFVFGVLINICFTPLMKKYFFFVGIVSFSRRAGPARWSYRRCRACID